MINTLVSQARRVIKGSWALTAVECGLTHQARRFFKNRSAATAIEYGLIAALIAVVIIGAITALGGGLTNTFNTVKAKLGG